MNSYDSFDHWYDAQSTHDKKIINRLRELIDETAPRLTEASKWGNGVWATGELPLLYIHTKPDHVEFGFFAGASLSDPNNLLRGKAKYVRHIPLQTIDDINGPAFASLIREAVRAPAYK